MSTIEKCFYMYRFLVKNKNTPYGVFYCGPKGIRTPDLLGASEAL